MIEWMVEYQKVPTNYSPRECAVVKAPTAVDAWVAMYDKLVRSGRTVDTAAYGAYSNEFQAEIEERVSRSYGSTLIYLPKPYKATFVGEVLS